MKSNYSYSRFSLYTPNLVLYKLSGNHSSIANIKFLSIKICGYEYKNNAYRK